MQASGAYIFRPNSSDTYPVNNNSNKASITVAMVSVTAVCARSHGNNIGTSGAGGVAGILIICLSSSSSVYEH